MKKLIVLLVTCFMVIGLAAQTDTYFGLKAGLNLSTQKVDYPVGTTTSIRPGFNGGIYFYFDFPNFVLQPEILYSNQGTNIKLDDENLYDVFNYVSIPIMFKYVLKQGISFELGPQFAYLICNKSDYQPIDNIKYEEQYYTTAYKSTDFLISFGIGWESKKNLMVGARYSLGLTSINDYEGIPDTKNRVLSINVGYKIVKLNK